MRSLRLILASAVLAAAVLSVAQDDQNNAPAPAPGIHKPVSLPPPASFLLTQAEQQAKADGKNVLVIYHASWCGWCKRLDKFMTDPQYQQVFDDNFVTVKLTVLEDEKHKLDENPGGLDQMDLMGGHDAGLPLFAILSPDGKMIINSMRPVDGEAKGENTGFPAKPEEIDHFATMMQKGAPKITTDQIAAMKTYLVQAEAQRQAEAAAAKKTAGSGNAGGGGGR